MIMTLRDMVSSNLKKFSLSEGDGNLSPIRFELMATLSSVVNISKCVSLNQRPALGRLKS